MKNVKYKLISVALIIAILSGMLVINASADEEYDTLLQYYFEELEGDVPANIHGSCGYVALCMMLSFYDFYWDDRFIDIEYENPIKPSINYSTYIPSTLPGINLENILLPNYRPSGYENNENVSIDDETIYRLFIDQYKNKFLHMNLLSRGISQGLHPTGENEEDFGISLEESAALLDEYFDLIFGEEEYYNQYGIYDDDVLLTIHVVSEDDLFYDRDDVITIIKNQISTGFPVIYSGEKDLTGGGGGRSLEANGEKSRHAMIAYHVDASNDVLLHKGYAENYSSKLSTIEYDADIAALWIEINENLLPHRCSNQFVFYPTYSAKREICVCNAYKGNLLHPKHQHSICEYVSYTTSSHTYTCYCGQTFTYSHNFYRYENLGASGHRIYCDCGASITANHSFYRYTNLGESGHTAYCTCGYSKTEVHELVNIPNKPKRCNKCTYVDTNYYEPWGDSELDDKLSN